jgi:hypothetical protein
MHASKPFFSGQSIATEAAVVTATFDTFAAFSIRYEFGNRR